jgi:hypothetical protein
LSKSDDLHISMYDIRRIVFAGFAAFAEVLEPRQIAEVTAFLHAFANRGNQTTEVQDAIRQLANIIEGKEPESEPAPRGSHLKLVEPDSGPNVA